jgi:signal peptidase I
MLELIEFIKDVLGYIIIIAIIILVRIYIITPAQVNESSMEPNLHNKQIIVIDQIRPRFYQYERFDIVVFDHDNPSYLIKRIIGLPGEKVAFKDNKLYINDQEIAQPFEQNGDTEDFSITDLEYNTIPKDMYLVLGDNRINSVDSRTIGLIPKDKINGKALAIIWPLDQIKLIK